MLRIGSEAVFVIISARYERVTQRLFCTATVLGNVHTKSLYGHVVEVAERKAESERERRDSSGKRESERQREEREGERERERETERGERERGVS
jgi:hypothetical protein